MEQRNSPASARRSTGNPPLRRGQVRNRIIREFFRSLAALVRAGSDGSGSDSGTTTSTSTSAYNSEATSDS